MTRAIYSGMRTEFWFNRDGAILSHFRNNDREVALREARAFAQAYREGEHRCGMDVFHGEFGSRPVAYVIEEQDYLGLGDGFRFVRRHEIGG